MGFQALLPDFLLSLLISLPLGAAVAYGYAWERGRKAEARETKARSVLAPAE